MYGEGLLKGLKVTMNHYFKKSITQEYPDVMPDLPQTVQTYFALDPDKCNACGICANACPNKVITIEKYKDENNKNKLAGYHMNLLYCLYCGLCMDSCPKNALRPIQEFEKASYDRDGVKATLYKLDKIPQVTAKEVAKEDEA